MEIRETRVKQIRCRKSHACEWCGERIQSGEEAWSRTVFGLDAIGTFRSHLDCHSAMDKSAEAMRKDLFYEWYPGDFKRGEVYEAYEPFKASQTSLK